ncbi:MAG: menaquinone-specific isochorismate synthase, partial [Actinomycetota bacterium]|nr:menaquinone-specific isochorismate synthase [Actinomycetota bacterium]
MTSDTRFAPAHPRLVARTEHVVDLERLTDCFGPNGTAWLDGECGFVTAGVAAIVDPRDAVATLRAIEHTGEAPDAIGPRAVGALPFAGGGRMVIPARVMARDAAGRVWRTTIDSAEHAAALQMAPGAPSPSRYTVEQRTTRDQWEASVVGALALIDAGAAEKIVLAREVAIEADAPFDVRSVLETLHATQPGCVVYADGGFVGASPELLVRRTGESVVARPMAGTGLDAAELVRSEKDAREHRFVVDAVCDALMSTCAEVVANGPAPVELTDVAHLATTITARIRDHQTSAVDLARALHPTPAVAGTPRAAALAAIRRLESTPRDLYAGPCGWVDARGDGAFVVALRGAQIEGTRARLHAGAGIVPGSNPEAEWAETRAK